MTRISEEELAHLREIAATHTGGVEMRQWKALAIMDELRERRAADLTAEEQAHLVEAKRCMMYHCENGEDCRPVVRVLDRLLAHGGEP